MKMLIPILIIAVSNTVYNICSKSTPANINTFASLSVTYTTAAVSAIALYFLTGRDKDLASEFAKLNWAPFALGLAIVGLESGFILAYRTGWKINSTQLVASVATACILAVAGFFLYRETLSVRQIAGIGVCAVGLFLLSK